MEYRNIFVYLQKDKRKEKGQRKDKKDRGKSWETMKTFKKKIKYQYEIQVCQ